MHHAQGWFAIVCAGTMLTFAWVCCASGGEPFAERSSTLDPDDIGIAKYVVGGEAKRGQLVVCYTQESMDGKDGLRTLTYSNAHGKPKKWSVLVINRSLFSDSESGNFLIKSPGISRGTIRTNGTMAHGWSKDGKVWIEYEDREGRKVGLKFEVRIEDYAAVKRRVPDLPEDEFEWEGNHVELPPTP